jgi:hypothetical protein
MAGTARLVMDEFAAVGRRTQHTLTVEADEDAVGLGDGITTACTYSGDAKP